MSTPARPRRPPPKFHRVTVSEVTVIIPQMRRISFTGADLADYPNDGPGTHCKILLAAPGQSEVALPAPGGDGGSSVEPRPVMRTYTQRLIDTAARTLTVDFALHEHAGPASAWAAAATSGDALVVTGGRGAYRNDAEADWTVLVADAWALPAVAIVLDDAPTGARVLLVAEVADAGEDWRFDTRAELTTTWCHPDPVAAAGTTAAEHVAQLAFPVGPGRFWVGGWRPPRCARCPGISSPIAASTGPRCTPAPAGSPAWSITPTTTPATTTDH